MNGPMLRQSVRSSISSSLVFVAVSVAMACVPKFGDDLSIVAFPRLVAVRAEPAEARAGTEVRLTALVLSPAEGDPAEERLEWALCSARKPLTELGPVSEPCIEEFGAGGDIFRRLGRGRQVAGTIPGDACRRFGPLSPPADASGIAGRPVDPDPTGGYYQPVVVGTDIGTTLGSVRLACGATGLPSTELIRYNQGYRPNENPEIERLDARAAGRDWAAVAPRVAGEDVAPLRVQPNERIELRASWPSCPREPSCGDGFCSAGENPTTCREDCGQNPRGCGGAEAYLAPDPLTRTVRTRREGIAVAWYATAGTFEDEQTGRSETDPDGVDTENTWVAPDGEGRVRLWLVVRDDRGGVGFREYVVDVTR
jgi:hypothetical protein